MEYYIIDYFHKYFALKAGKNIDKRAKFLFFAFLIEVGKIPTKALTEIISTKNEIAKKSVREKFILDMLLKRANNNFSHILITSSNSN